MSVQRRLLALCLSGLIAGTGIADDAKDRGFVPLFNGKDLTGWKPYANQGKDVWGAENGLLFTKGGSAGWLMTEKEYGDFELELEYNLPKGGNSGVAIRAPLQGNPAYEGMEIQLLDDHSFGKRIRPTQFTGSIYDVVPAGKHVAKPGGEWNHMKVIAKERKISIELNGTVIVDANLDDYKEHVQGNPKAKQPPHPGLVREKGHIGLQAYNLRVDFRNLRLRPLD